MDNIERRFTSRQTAPVGVERRADGKKIVVGYAAVWYRDGDPGTEYQLWKDCVERIAPTAFDRALKEDHDVRGLFNHGPDHLLGRTGSGTLRLSVDNVGLRYELDPPDTQAGRDVVTSIERGDLTGSSFAFAITGQTWQERNGEPDLRIVTDLDLYDVGPVTYPAYKSSTTGVRCESTDDDRAAYEAWKQRMKARQDRVATLI